MKLFPAILAFISVPVLFVIASAHADNSQLPIELYSSSGAYITKANDKPAGEAHIVDNTDNGGSNDDFAVFDFSTQTNLPPKRAVASITVTIQADLHNKYLQAGRLDFYIGTDNSVGIGNADTGDHCWEASVAGPRDNPLQVLPAEGPGLGSGIGIGSYFGTPSTFISTGQGQWNTSAVEQQFTFTVPYSAETYLNKQLSSKGNIRLFIADDSRHTVGGDAELALVPPWLTITTVPAQ